MKAISLWQPWATLVAIGAKRYETRSWPNHYVGPVVIHAAMKWLKDLAATARSWPFAPALGADPLTRGCLLGVVDFAESLIVRTNRDGFATLRSSDGSVGVARPEWSFGDYAVGRYATPLTNVRRFEKPIPWKGRQGWFDVPDEIVEAALAVEV